jgi:hypothetical protein
MENFKTWLDFEPSRIQYLLNKWYYCTEPYREPLKAKRGSRALNEKCFTPPLYELDDVGCHVVTAANGQRLLSIAIPKISYSECFDALEIARMLNEHLPDADTSVRTVVQFMQNNGLLPYPVQSIR